jgi:small-conductance mechanosensitive channel
VIPNSELFKNSVTVNTAFDTRRLEYDFKIAKFQQIEDAKAVIVRVMQESEDVLPDPKADVVVTGFDSSTVTLRARWWSRSRISDVLLAQDRVLGAARRALTAAGVILPSTTQSIEIRDNDRMATTATPDDNRPRTALEKDAPPVISDTSQSRNQ